MSSGTVVQLCNFTIARGGVVNLEIATFSGMKIETTDKYCFYVCILHAKARANLRRLAEDRKIRQIVG